MIISIYEGYDNSYIMLGSKDERFRRAWGSVEIPTSAIYKNLAQVAAWCNNEIDEECLFKIS